MFNNKTKYIFNKNNNQNKQINKLNNKNNLIISNKDNN